MIMVADSVPSLKKWVGALGLKKSTKLLVIRVVVAFLLHAGRMSCLRAAGAVRCETRHRAQISRFLARPRWRKLDINTILRSQLLELEVRRGRIRVHRRRNLGHPGRQEDAEHVQHGQPPAAALQRASLRQNQARSEEVPQLHDGTSDHAVRHPDSFLQTISHARVLQGDWPRHRTTAEAAADLIRELPLPEGAEVLVLGDRPTTPMWSATLARTVVIRGYFPATPSAYWLARKGTGPRCVRF